MSVKLDFDSASQTLHCLTQPLFADDNTLDSNHTADLCGRYLSALGVESETLDRAMSVVDIPNSRFSRLFWSLVGKIQDLINYIFNFIGLEFRVKWAQAELNIDFGDLFFRYTLDEMRLEGDGFISNLHMDLHRDAYALSYMNGNKPPIKLEKEEVQDCDAFNKRLQLVIEDQKKYIPALFKQGIFHFLDCLIHHYFFKKNFVVTACNIGKPPARSLVKIDNSFYFEKVTYSRLLPIVDGPFQATPLGQFKNIINIELDFKEMTSAVQLLIMTRRDGGVI